MEMVNEYEEKMHRQILKLYPASASKPRKGRGEKRMKGTSTYVTPGVPV